VEVSKENTLAPIDVANFKPVVPEFVEPAKPASPGKTLPKQEPDLRMTPCRLPVLLVPFADDRAKTGSKIVVFDVVAGK
jgi:hypothetical protein